MKRVCSVRRWDGETVRPSRLDSSLPPATGSLQLFPPTECKERSPERCRVQVWLETPRTGSRAKHRGRCRMCNVSDWVGQCLIWTNSERFRFSNLSKHGFLHFQIQTNTRDTCDASVDCAAAQRALLDKIRDGRVGKWRPDIWETAWAMLRYCCYSPNVCICYNSPQTQMSLTAIVRDMPIKCCKVFAT